MQMFYNTLNLPLLPSGRFAESFEKNDFTSFEYEGTPESSFHHHFYTPKSRNSFKPVDQLYDTPKSPLKRDF